MGNCKSLGSDGDVGEGRNGGRGGGVQAAGGQGERQEKGRGKEMGCDNSASRRMRMLKQHELHLA